LVGMSKPARMLSAVDLPQPDGPSSAMNSPRATSSVTSFSALKAPKSRQTFSSRRRRKLCEARAIATVPSLPFGAADLLVPAREGIDELVGHERQFLREIGYHFLIFRTAEFLNGVLAFLRRHGESDVFARGAGIEIALVVGGGLRLWGEQIVQEVDKD